MNFVSDTVKRWYSLIDIINRSKFLFSVSPKALVVGRSLAVVLQSDECNGRKSDKCLNQKFIKMDTPQPRWWSCGTQWSIRTLVVDLDINVASMWCAGCATRHRIPFTACKSLFLNSVRLGRTGQNQIAPRDGPVPMVVIAPDGAVKMADGRSVTKAALNPSPDVLCGFVFELPVLARYDHPPVPFLHRRQEPRSTPSRISRCGRSGRTRNKRHCLVLMSSPI